MSTFDDQLPTPPAWVAQALCAEIDYEIFWPEKGGSSRMAKSICARCEVISECLAYAMASSEPYGIFGGTTPRERRALKDGAAA